MPVELALALADSWGDSRRLLWLSDACNAEGRGGGPLQAPGRLASELS